MTAIYQFKDNPKHYLRIWFQDAKLWTQRLTERGWSFANYFPNAFMLDSSFVKLDENSEEYQKLNQSPNHVYEGIGEKRMILGLTQILKCQRKFLPCDNCGGVVINGPAYGRKFFLEKNYFITLPEYMFLPTCQKCKDVYLTLAQSEWIAEKYTKDYIVSAFKRNVKYEW